MIKDTLNNFGIFTKQLKLPHKPREQLNITPRLEQKHRNCRWPHGGGREVRKDKMN